MAIKGSIKQLDTKDVCTKTLGSGKWEYKLKITGRGHCRFKIKAVDRPLLGESGRERWRTIENRSRVNGGTTLRGDFAVGPMKLSSKVTVDRRELKFIFSRGLGTKGVSYHCELTRLGDL